MPTAARNSVTALCSLKTRSWAGTLIVAICASRSNPCRLRRQNSPRSHPPRLRRQAAARREDPARKLKQELEGLDVPARLLEVAAPGVEAVSAQQQAVGARVLRDRLH